MTIIRKRLDKPNLELTPETRADEIPLWDSLANMDIVMAVEAEFRGVQFLAQDIEDLRDGDLGLFVSMVEAKLNAVRK